MNAHKKKTALAFSHPRGNAEKHNLSSRYLSNKHTARHKLPVTCLIGIHLSVEDCLCNCVLCARVEMEIEASLQLMNERSLLLRRGRIMSSLDPCALQTGSGLRGEAGVFKRRLQDAINYLCSPFGRSDVFQCGSKIGEEFELIFQKWWVEKKIHPFIAGSFSFQVNLALVLNGRFENWWQSCGHASQDRLRL